MRSGAQSLESVLAEARTMNGKLEKAFDVPVLLLVSEEGSMEGATAVTAPGAPARPEFARMGSATFVVPIQPRVPSPGNHKFSFGRSTICDLVLPFPSISKHHGYFEQLGGTWSVLDVGSTYGTAVDGHPVSKTGTALTDDCVLLVGKVSARFLSAKGFGDVLRARLGLD